MGISVQPIGKVGEIQTICSLSITQVEPGNLQPNLQTVDLCNSRVATVSRAEVMDWVGKQAVSREGGAPSQQVRASWLNNALVWLGWVFNC